MKMSVISVMTLLNFGGPLYLESDRNSVSVLAPKLTYNVVSVQFWLRWRRSSALSFFGWNCSCSADDRKLPKVEMASQAVTTDYNHGSRVRAKSEMAHSSLNSVRLHQWAAGNQHHAKPGNTLSSCSVQLAKCMTTDEVTSKVTMQRLISHYNIRLTLCTQNDWSQWKTTASNSC